MATYVCDLCGFQSEDRAAILSHVRDEHQVNDPATLGSLEQDDGLLILRDQDGATALDMGAWLGAQLAKLPRGPVTTDFDTLTLTTAHAASSYGVPVLVIDGQAYGPGDMTPAGVTAAELLRQFYGRFMQFEYDAPVVEHARILEALLRDLWAGAVIGSDDAGFVNVPPAITRRVVAVLRG